MKKFFFTGETALMVGGIIGAGVMGLPYAIAKSGFLIGAGYIIIVGIIMIALHLMVYESGVYAKENLQLSGLANHYLGTWAKIIVSIMYVLALIGALVAYIIGVGEAVFAIAGWSATAWSILFFLIFSFFIYKGIKAVEKEEFVLCLMIIAIIVLIAVALAPHFNFYNLKTINLEHFFTPFGVVFFAMFGISAVPAIVSVSRNKVQHGRKAIIFGTLIPILLYLVFTATVLGVTGKNTTEVATVGLGVALGNFLVVLGNLFAIFAMSTGFIIIGSALKNTFNWDWKIPHNISWALAVFIPLVIFIFSAKSFASTIDFIGKYLLTALAVFAVIIFAKMLYIKRKSRV